MTEDELNYAIRQKGQELARLLVDNTVGPAEAINQLAKYTAAILATFMLAGNMREGVMEGVTDIFCKMITLYSTIGFEEGENWLKEKQKPKH